MGNLVFFVPLYYVKALKLEAPARRLPAPAVGQAVRPARRLPHVWPDRQAETPAPRLPHPRSAPGMTGDAESW